MTAIDKASLNRISVATMGSSLSRIQSLNRMERIRLLGPCMVRQGRPIASLLVICVWLGYRLAPRSVSPHRRSFLDVFVSSIKHVQRMLIHQWMDQIDSAWQHRQQSTSLNIAFSALIQFSKDVLSCCCVLLEDVLAILLLWSVSRVIYLVWTSRGHWKRNAVDWFLGVAFAWSKQHVPAVRSALRKQVEALRIDGPTKLLHKKADRHILWALPEQGRDPEDVLKELTLFTQQENKAWNQGKLSGTVYYTPNASHRRLMSSVYDLYANSNPLHPGCWPKLNQCEGELIAMTANMLHAPSDPPIGCVTSGGTESILLAVRAHLSYYGRRRGVWHPEIVAGTSAHAALHKACDMYGIRLILIDCNNGSTFQLDASQVQRKITSNTIMIYASAPSFPQGVIDPIAELSDIALCCDIGLHVDACLGGFILPFLQNSDQINGSHCSHLDPPIFDFRAPGVTSMSADTHKYGLAAKGTSVVVYRHNELRHAQYFTYPDWAGGMYATPTLAGSRPGALTACAWAALVSLGRAGYEERARQIVDATRRIAVGIRQIEGLQLLTSRPYMVVCFATSDPRLSIYQIQDALKSQTDWSLNALQNPASIHLCVTLNVVPNVEIFLRDLRAAVDYVRQGYVQLQNKGQTSDPGAYNNYRQEHLTDNNSNQVACTSQTPQGTAGIYGMAAALPPGPVAELLHAFIDLTLEP